MKRIDLQRTPISRQSFDKPAFPKMKSAYVADRVSILGIDFETSPGR